MRGATRRLWQEWQALAGHIGDFQARLLLTVFYFTVAVPFGLAARLFGDRLELRRRPSRSGWHPRAPGGHDLRAAGRQF
jgi:hypothetical protein